MLVVTRFPAASLQVRTPSEIIDIGRAFAHVTHHNYPQNAGAMVSGSEWRDVFTFWSRVLAQRSQWELDGDIFAVS